MGKNNQVSCDMYLYVYAGDREGVIVICDAKAFLAAIPVPHQRKDIHIVNIRQIDGIFPRKDGVIGNRNQSHISYITVPFD